MDTNKNSYTFIFASVMVLVIAVVLSVAALGLKKPQDNNLKMEKMQSILRTIGVDVPREEAEVLYNQYIKAQIGLNDKGEEVENGAKVFAIDLSTSYKKPASEQVFPLFLAEKDGKKYYIIPLWGDGLWNAIWGYIALEEDMNTVYGVVFDHKSETAGLGAEINKVTFQEPFKGKKIFQNGRAKFHVQKGGVNTLAVEEQEYAVDAISGGTLTSDGVTNMIQERLNRYVPYFEKVLASSSVSSSSVAKDDSTVVTQ